MNKPDPQQQEKQLNDEELAKQLQLEENEKEKRAIEIDSIYVKETLNKFVLIELEYLNKVRETAKKNILQTYQTFYQQQKFQEATQAIKEISNLDVDFMPFYNIIIQQDFKDNSFDVFEYASILMDKLMDSAKIIDKNQLKFYKLASKIFEAFGQSVKKQINQK